MRNELKKFLWNLARFAMAALFVFDAGMCSAADEAPLDRWGLQRAYLRQKLDTVIASRRDVWVVYLSQNGDRYSVTFNVRHATSGLFLQTTERGVSRPLDMIMPTIDFLRNHALKGYKSVLVRRNPVRITTASFYSFRGYIFEQGFKKCGFYCTAFRDFLEHSGPKLIGKGCAEFDYRLGKPLVADILRRMIPSTRRVQWSHVDDEVFLEEVVLCPKGKKVIFMIIPGTGVLRGCMPLSLHSVLGDVLGLQDFSRRSLYSYKLRGACGLMAELYRYSESEWVKCINFPLYSKRESVVLGPCTLRGVYA